MAEARAQTEQKRTTVEDGTEIKGQLSSSCPLIIKGKVEGEVAAPAVLVDGSGSLTGTAIAKELSSSGFLSGEFEADKIMLAGKVGDKTVIKAKALEARLSTNGEAGLQVTFGECRLEIGDDPKAAPAKAPAKQNGK